MGLTNRVQPYCRFAIITMQMMPKISCPQRVASDAVARTSMVLVVVDISFLLLLLVARRHCVPCLRSQPRRYSNKLSTLLHNLWSPRINKRGFRPPRSGRLTAILV